MVASFSTSGHTEMILGSAGPRWAVSLCGPDGHGGLAHVGIRNATKGIPHPTSAGSEHTLAGGTDPGIWEHSELAALICGYQDGQGFPGPGGVPGDSRASPWGLLGESMVGGKYRYIGHIDCLVHQPVIKNSSCGNLEVVDVPVTNTFTAGDSGKGFPWRAQGSAYLLKLNNI